MGVKRAPSAYFVFANEQRACTKEELQAAAEDGKAPSVAKVAKSIGQKWRVLGEAGQQPYKDKAAVLAAEAAAAAANEDETEENSQPADAQDATDTADDEIPGLPLTSVKRIMCTDEDVARVSGDCVKAVASLTELFLQLLASRAQAKAKQQKRSTIKFCDVQHAAMADKRMVEMGLKDMFAYEALFADARDGKENQPVHKAVANSKADIPAGRPITDFFKA